MVSGIILAEITSVCSPLSGKRGEHWDHTFWEPRDLDGSIYQLTKEDAVDAFWRTLLVDQGNYFGLRMLPEEMQHFRDEYLIWTGRHRRKDSLHLNDPTSPTNFEARYSFVFDNMHDSLRGYTFAVLDNGYWGIIPSVAKKGDSICVGLGLDVPVVIREVENSESESLLYSFVGPAYIHGVMDGEILEDIEAGKLHQQLVRIR